MFQSQNPAIVRKLSNGFVKFIKGRIGKKAFNFHYNFFWSLFCGNEFFGTKVNLDFFGAKFQPVRVGSNGPPVIFQNLPDYFMKLVFGHKIFI